VIAKVEHQHFVIGRELLPEGQIGIRGKPIAVRHHHTRAIPVSVTPHLDSRPILQLNFEGFEGSRNSKFHFAVYHAHPLERK
jgi:hypothetical protein